MCWVAFWSWKYAHGLCNRPESHTHSRNSAAVILSMQTAGTQLLVRMSNSHPKLRASDAVVPQWCCTMSTPAARLVVAQYPMVMQQMMAIVVLAAAINIQGRSGRFSTSQLPCWLGTSVCSFRPNSSDSSLQPWTFSYSFRSGFGTIIPVHRETVDIGQVKMCRLAVEQLCRIHCLLVLQSFRQILRICRVFPDDSDTLLSLPTFTIKVICDNIF